MQTHSRKCLEAFGLGIAIKETLMHINGLDEIGNSLLTLLKENARYSYSELGEKVGLSRVAVKNRIDAMEEMGLIRGYEVKIAPRSIDNSVEFIVNISPKPEYYEYAVDMLSNSDMIQKVMAVTGDCKIYAFGTAPNAAALDSFYRRVRSVFTEVCYLSFDIIASIYKDVDGGIEYEGKKQKRTEDA